MSVMSSVIYAIIAPGLLMIGTLPLNGASSTAVSPLSVYGMRTLPSALGAIKTPDIQSPAWLKAQDVADAAASRAAAAKRTVTYSVTTRGTLAADVTEFRLKANATLNDSRGWARFGVVFTEVASGGNFVLVLSEASQLPSFSSGCSPQYSCRVGQYVIINQDRWLSATPSWNNAGGSIGDYRNMVVNHETGHWLGHNHQSCGGAGQVAPVMQQQSIDLQGCTFNAWPLAGELWSTQLGIDTR